MGRKRKIFDAAIVADGNRSIGLGHIMRSLAVAEALKDLGYRVCFLVSDADSEAVVRSLGSDCFRLDTDYRRLADQAEKIKACLEKIGARFVFFDSYFADNALFEAVSEICPVGCFGYGKKYFSGMRVIVPYGVSSDWDWYAENFDPQVTEVLAGAAYAPLKRPFWDVPAREEGREVRRILLTSGGTDPLGVTEILAGEILARFPDTVLDIVVGRYFETDRLKTRFGSCEAVRFHERLDDLSGLMRETDLAVSAAGMTLYELMACSVPVIAYALADNQLNNVRLEPAIVWCGDIRSGQGLNGETVSGILAHLEDLMRDAAARGRLQKAGHAFCDGKGAVRIAGAIGRIISPLSE
nr:hypothetical protein [Lachnospiraceae bacterium]